MLMQVSFLIGLRSIQLTKWATHTHIASLSISNRMPIASSPDYPYEFSLRGRIKQCQNSACLVRETETQSLFTCAGCRRTRYCVRAMTLMLPDYRLLIDGHRRLDLQSKECQKGDWKLHKPLCIVGQHDRQRNRQTVKDDTQRDTLKLICGLNAQQAEVLSKKWAEVCITSQRDEIADTARSLLIPLSVQRFQGVILKAAYMALDIYHFPDRTYTHVLSIILDPNFTENNIPRQDGEIVKAFAFIDARVMRWSDFGMDREKYPQLKAVFDKAEDVQSKLDGARK
jgi:hypothetical protein